MEANKSLDILAKTPKTKLSNNYPNAKKYINSSHFTFGNIYVYIYMCEKNYNYH